MTDERQGDALPEIVARLPHESGIVFRHYSLASDQRRMLFERIRTIARGRLVLLAGDAALAA
ncbi:MAG: hypothetical protein AB7S59_25080, partial [Parvibaculaceae bacterium]